jgi:hypothetical protein
MNVVEKIFALPDIKHRTAQLQTRHCSCSFSPSKTYTMDIPLLSSVMHFDECLCAQVWDCNATEIDLSNGERRVRTLRWEENGEEETATLAPTVMADATTENIQKAKEFINGLTASGGKVAVSCAL